MLEIIKKFDAATIKALAIATVPLLALIATLFGVDEAVFNAKADKVLQIVLALVTQGGIAWAVWSRLFKPTPPLTETAQQKTLDMIADGKLEVTQSTIDATQRAKNQADTKKGQGGFTLPSLLVFLLAAAMATSVVVTASGCTGTRAAYNQADTMVDRAYVAEEQYYAVLREARTIVTDPATTEDVKQAIKKAELESTPWIVGDKESDPPKPSIRDFVNAYKSVKDGKTATELQTAVTNAERVVAEFIKAVNAARGTS